MTVSETPSTAIEPFSATKRASSAGSAEAHGLPRVARGARDDHAGAVDVALDDVAVQAGVGADRALEVDPVARRAGRR